MMDSPLKMKIMVNKSGAELKRAERQMEIMEESLRVACSAMAHIEHSVKGGKCK